MLNNCKSEHSSSRLNLDPFMVGLILVYGWVDIEKCKDETSITTLHTPTNIRWTKSFNVCTFSKHYTI